jgi:site-specific DNA-methyltransferase (adenine-specific)
MFSFESDTVLDPFLGTGTTMLAAMKTNRNRIGVEIDSEYCQMALKRLKKDGRTLFNQIEIIETHCDGINGIVNTSGTHAVNV